jgi:hypothetical protein
MAKDKVRDLSTELKVLNPETARLGRDDLRRLVIKTQNGAGETETFEDVRLVRSFPLTCPDRWIGVTDSEGRHLGMIAALDQLDEATRALVDEELEKRYFIPTISRVVSFKIKMGVHSWDVISNRGPRRFDVRERDDYRPLKNNRLIIRDVDGNRYEIEDYLALDARTIDQIEQVL